MVNLWFCEIFVFIILEELRLIFEEVDLKMFILRNCRFESDFEKIRSGFLFYNSL